jgi:organic radical activating enzyme
VRPLKKEEFLKKRFAHGRALGLFITDRCPVGCLHCSVDSRSDSPRITDYNLFEQLVDAMCNQTNVELVGITGGEPFIERRGLTLAVHRFDEAQKHIVLFTSGVWARPGRQPKWIEQILPLASCVILSTDGFHARTVGEAQFVAAARAIQGASVPLIVQLLESPEEIAEVERLLEVALGAAWREYAELSLIRGLPWGRGASFFRPPDPHLAADMGAACRLLAGPMVRYDGRITACCNEAVLMGHGPARLRRRATSGKEAIEALQAIRSDSLLRAMAKVPVGALTAHPRYAHLADQKVHGLCDLCWRMQDATTEPLGQDDDQVLALLPTLIQNQDQ